MGEQFCHLIRTVVDTSLEMGDAGCEVSKESADFTC